MIWSVLVRVAQGSRMNLSVWDLHLHFSGIISQSRSVHYLCSLFPGPNSLAHVVGSSFSCVWGELGQRFSVCADVDEEVLVVFPPLESPDGRAPADSALGPLEGRLLPLLYSLRWRRMTANNSWLTWRYEAVIPALWMQWALLWDWVTDEGFSSQSVTRATASSSSCGGPAARVPLVERCFVRRPSGWSLAGGLVSMSSYSGHPSSPNVSLYSDGETSHSKPSQSSRYWIH